MFLKREMREAVPCTMVLCVVSFFMLTSCISTGKQLSPERRKSKAVKDPVEAALLIGETTRDPAFRNVIFRGVVAHYTKTGNHQAAIDLVTDRTWGYERINLLIQIAEQAQKRGQVEKIESVLRLAHEIAMTEKERDVASLLAMIAHQHLELKQTEQARTLFENALKVTKTMTAKNLLSSRAHALMFIAKGFSEMGEKDKARSLFSEALRVDRNPDWFNISKNYAEASLFDEALSTMKKIDDWRNRSNVLNRIAVALAKAGMKTRSLDVFLQSVEATVQEKTSKEADRFLWPLMDGEHFDEDFLRRADEQLERVDSVQTKLRFLPKLAVAYHKAGKQEKALTLMSEALKYSKANPRFSPEYLVVAYAKIGQVKRAISIARAMKLSDYALTVPLGEVAVYLADKWPSESVDALLDEAYQFAQEELLPWNVAIQNLTEHAVTNYIALGEMPRAIALLDRALSRLESEIVPSAWHLTHLGRRYAEAGARVKAMSLLRRALKRTEQESEKMEQAKDMAKIAEAIVEAGETDEALSILSEIPHRFVLEKNKSVVRIARDLIDHGKNEKAFELLSPLIQSAVESFGPPNNWFLRELGTELIKIGKTPETLRLIDLMEANGSRASLLINLSKHYFDAGNKVRAIESLEKIEMTSSYGFYGGTPPFDDIAELWEKYGDPRKAEETLRQKKNRLKQKSGYASSKENEDLIWLAVSYAQAGFFDEAYKIAQSTTEGFLDGVDWIFAGGMWSVVYHFIEEKEYEKATALLIKAKQFASGGELGIGQKSPLLLRIAENYLKMGELDKGLDLLQEAFAEAEVAPRGTAFRMIGDSYLRIGKQKKAFIAYFRAVELSRDMFPEWTRAIELGSITLSLIREKVPVNAQTQALLRDIVYAMD